MKKTDGKQNKKILNAELQEWKNKYLRALADYQNLEKRTEEEIIRRTEQEKKQIILELLSILDDIERAEIFIKDQGLINIKETFIKFLQKMNVSEIDLLNKNFDPNWSECVEIVPAEEDGKIVEIVKKGYTFANTLVRCAQVKVGKKK